VRRVLRAGRRPSTCASELCGAFAGGGSSPRQPSSGEAHFRRRTSSSRPLQPPRSPASTA
jgi:hypothetical protein